MAAIARGCRCAAREGGFLRARSAHWGAVTVSAHVRLASQAAARSSGVTPRNSNASMQRTPRRAPKVKMRPVEGDPLLKDVLRKFLMRVHPDRFHKFPELRVKNDVAVKALMGVLSGASRASGGVIGAVGTCQLAHAQSVVRCRHEV